MTFDDARQAALEDLPATRTRRLPPICHRAATLLRLQPGNLHDRPTTGGLSRYSAQ